MSSVAETLACYYEFNPEQRAAYLARVEAGEKPLTAIDDFLRWGKDGNIEACMPDEKQPAVIATLPYVSRISPEHDPDGDTLPVCVWKADENHGCEMAHQGEPCDLAGGIMYGTDDPFTARFCPLHYYKMHFGPNPAYTLESALTSPR